MLIIMIHCTKSVRRIICMLCQQTSPKRWFANVNMTSYCDVTKSAFSVLMTTIRHCSIQKLSRGAHNHAVAPGATRPLHAIESIQSAKGRPCLGVALNRSLTYRQHLVSLRKKLTSRVVLMRRLAGVERHFWPLRNFWSIIVCQLFSFSE